MRSIVISLGRWTPNILTQAASYCLWFPCAICISPPHSFIMLSVICRKAVWLPSEWNAFDNPLFFLSRPWIYQFFWKFYCENIKKNLKLKFMYYTFHPIIVYGSMVFSIFMELCSHHHYLISGNFLIPAPQRNHISVVVASHFLQISWALAMHCTAQPFLSVSFSLHLCILWDTTVLKLSQLIILHWPLSVQVKGRIACISLYIKS